MATRIEVNIQTGEVKTIELTQEELDAAAAAKAAEDDFNSLENTAERDMRGSFESGRIQRLVFEVEFNQENRIRVLEGKPVITRLQYRDALVTLYKTL